MILWFFGLCALLGAVVGIVQQPKQTRQTTQQTARKQPIQARSHAEDNEKEIAYLECKLVQLEDLQRRIETEYQKADSKKAIALHRQMITLDEQIYKTSKRLEGLKHD